MLGMLRNQQNKLSKDHALVAVIVTVRVVCMLVYKRLLHVIKETIKETPCVGHTVTRGLVPNFLHACHSSSCVAWQRLAGLQPVHDHFSQDNVRLAAAANRPERKGLLPRQQWLWQ